MVFSEVKNCRVAVLLAAYNGEQYIVEQIDSILMQHDVDVTIFISVDRSSDSTHMIVNDYSNSHKNKVIVLPYGAKFGSAGSNFFRLLVDVDFSLFDYVAFADQDDIWLPNKLSSSISQMKATNSDAYSGNVTAFWPNNRQVLIKKDYPQKRYDYLFESAGPGCTFVFNVKLALAIKDILIEKSEKISTLWLHDWFCYSFARHSGYRWHIGSNPLMLYRQHTNNEVGANSGLSAILSRIKVVLSGDAFHKVLTQADFIEQDELPIRKLKVNSFLSLLSLSLHAFQCRRDNKGVFLFFIASILMSLKVLVTKNE
ncbi:glycosyltransferase [Shewanella algae]|uniref:glycosyltransferase n=1 Tax=Shewanella algae TaxID=38313 RepID=UPI000D654F7D|nr:glycosyltransferase [Shewanella algae]PWF91137.1 glycosyl transferase [Shewanella algae]